MGGKYVTSNVTRCPLTRTSSDEYTPTIDDKFISRKLMKRP